MVSDSVLLKRLRDILGSSDLDTATAGSIRRQLEEEFGIDLHDRKAFITEQIDIFLQSQDPESQNDGGGGDQEEDDNNQEMDAEEDDDIGDGSDEEAVKGSTSKAKKKGSGFTKPCAISPQLQEVVGVPEMARTEVVKKLWEYIRAKDLQNPKDKRKIICDETLRGIFKVNSINMFQMNKALSKHIWPIEYENETPVAESPQKEGKLKRSRQEGLIDVEPEPKGKEKQQKGKPSGFLAPLPMSNALVEFLGTGESTLPRSDVVKRMWKYIKDNDLQDPKDRRKIICDDKLNKLFKVRSFTGFTVSKLLKSHFVKSGG